MCSVFLIVSACHFGEYQSQGQLSQPLLQYLCLIIKQVYFCLLKTFADKYARQLENWGVLLSKVESCMKSRIWSLVFKQKNMDCISGDTVYL